MSLIFVVFKVIGFPFQMSKIHLSSLILFFLKEAQLNLFLLEVVRLMNVASVCYFFFDGNLCSLVFLGNPEKRDYHPSLIFMMDSLKLDYQLKISLCGFMGQLEEA